MTPIDAIANTLGSWMREEVPYTMLLIWKKPDGEVSRTRLNEEQMSNITLVTGTTFNVREDLPPNPGDTHYRAKYDAFNLPAAFLMYSTRDLTEEGIETMTHGGLMSLSYDHGSCSEAEWLTDEYLERLPIDFEAAAVHFCITTNTMKVIDQ